MSIPPLTNHWSPSLLGYFSSMESPLVVGSFEDRIWSRAHRFPEAERHWSQSIISRFHGPKDFSSPSTISTQCKPLKEKNPLSSSRSDKLGFVSSNFYVLGTSTFAKRGCTCSNLGTSKNLSEMGYDATKRYRRYRSKRERKHLTRRFFLSRFQIKSYDLWEPYNVPTLPTTAAKKIK